MNILFVIDNIEFKYFELNKLVTSFWLIEGFIKRGYRVDITTKDRLYLENNKPFALTFKTYLTTDDLLKEPDYSKTDLNFYNTIF